MSSRSRPFRAPRLLACAVALALVPCAASTAASNAPATKRPRPHYLRVATWNIGGILTDGSGHSHKKWKDRGPIVASQLLGRAPTGQRGRPADVIALQEANPFQKMPSGRTQYADLVHRLDVRATGDDHYRGLRTSLKSSSTRIAYNAHTVRLLKAGAFRWRAQESRVDGPRMMSWARFRQLATGSRFFFASVHLETASKAIRMRQWRQLIHVVPKLAHGLPVLIGGDFNATRNQRHNAADVFLPRMRRAGFGDSLGQHRHGNFAIARARPQRLSHANFNSVNFYRRALGHASRRSMVGQQVDYVFASNRLRVHGWSLVANLPRRGDRLRGTLPSDHQLIRVNVALRR